MMLNSFVSFAVALMLFGCSAPDRGEDRLTLSLQEYEQIASAEDWHSFDAGPAPTSLAEAVDAARIERLQIELGFCTGQAISTGDRLVRINTLIVAIQPLVEQGAHIRRECLDALHSEDPVMRSAGYLTLLGVYRIPLNFDVNATADAMENRSSYQTWEEVTTRLSPAPRS